MFIHVYFFPASRQANPIQAYRVQRILRRLEASAHAGAQSPCSASWRPRQERFDEICDKYDLRDGDAAGEAIFVDLLPMAMS